MSKGSVSQKDKEMAAYLKEIGHKRTSARCPICHQIRLAESASAAHRLPQIKRGLMSETMSALFLGRNVTRDRASSHRLASPLGTPGTPGRSLLA
jgi:hypothetical protein